MSELPRGWAKAKLGDIGKWSSGGTPKKSHSEYYDGSIPWVLTGDLNDCVLLDIPNTITALGLEKSSAKLFPRGTLLVAMYGATIGRTALLGKDATTNQACAALLADGETSKIIPFIWRYLISIRNELRSLGQGGAQPNISQAIIKEIDLKVPPLAEQKRIVEKLDSLSARSARAREELAHIPRLVARYKQAILAAAFRGDLTMEWRNANTDDSKPVDLKDLVRCRDDARTSKGMNSKGRNRSVPVDEVALTNIPDGWTWATFEDCAWDLTVGHVGSMKSRYKAEGIPFLRSLNVKPNAISRIDIRFVGEDFHSELKKSQLSPGDLVVVRTGEPGTAAVIPDEMPEANCSDLVICRLTDSVLSEYAAYYMNSDFAKKAVSSFQVGIAQQHFNVGAMSIMPLPVPTLAEQKEINRRIRSAFSRIDRIVGEHNRATHQLEHLDQSILAQAFRGELVPQDPTDEPASVLLERIRVERAKTQSPNRKRRKKAAS